MAISSKFKVLLAGLCLTAFVSGAQSAPVVVDDSVLATSYWGGNETNGWGNDEIVGTDSTFGINGMTVNQVGTTLNVVIDTFYSGTNIGNLGTTLGALFLGETSKLNYNLGDGGAPQYKSDTFAGDVDRFSHVLDFNGAVTNGVASQTPGANSATLYSLIGDGTDVVQSFGNGIIRAGQAVDVTAARKATAGAAVGSGDWAQETGKITFNIYNFFAPGGLGAAGGLYATGVTLAWAMTCANDVILARIPISGGSTGEVPLPAGVVLLLSGLLGLGFLGRFKAKSSKTVA